LSLVLIAFVACFAPTAGAAELDYYRGKTVRIIVGLAAGGGFDV